MSRKEQESKEQQLILQVLKSRPGILSKAEKKSTWVPLEKEGVLFKRVSGEGVVELERHGRIRNALAAHAFADRGDRKNAVGLLWMIVENTVKLCPLNVELLQEAMHKCIHLLVVYQKIDALLWVMPRVPGLLGRERFSCILMCRNPLVEIVKYSGAAFKALDKIHDNGYMHGDASLNNVFFAKNDETACVEAEWIDFENSHDLGKGSMPDRCVTGQKESSWGPERYFVKGQPNNKAKARYDYFTFIHSMNYYLGSAFSHHELCDGFDEVEKLGKGYNIHSLKPLISRIVRRAIAHKESVLKRNSLPAFPQVKRKRGLPSLFLSGDNSLAESSPELGGKDSPTTPIKSPCKRKKDAGSPSSVGRGGLACSASYLGQQLFFGSSDEGDSTPQAAYFTPLSTSL